MNVPKIEDNPFPDPTQYPPRRVAIVGSKAAIAACAITMLVLLSL